MEVQGPRSRCQALTDEAQMLCFLQFLAVFELVRAKSPQGRPARIALDFYQRKARRVYLQKPSNRIGYSGVFCDILRFQEGERLFRAHSHFDIMKGWTQGFPRHEVSDKQEVLFEDVSPSTAFSIRRVDELKMP